jgi:hypothetical protein
MRHGRARLSTATGCAALLLVLGAVAAVAQSPANPVTATLDVAPARVYQWQPFALTLTIDASNVRLSKNLELRGLPDKDRVQLGAFQELPAERHVEGDAIKETRRYRCEGLCLLPGPVVLAPTLQAAVIVQQRMLFGSRWVENPMEIRVPTATIEALPLPADGRPKDFSGAVGALTFSMKPTPTDVAVGDLIRTKITIRGKGYYDSLRPPAFTRPADFKVYDLRLLPGGPDERSFEQILIPLSTNATTIPALSFGYFDPNAGAYKTVTQGPFSVTFHSPKQIVDDDRYRPILPVAGAGTSNTATEATAQLAGLKAMSLSNAGDRATYEAAVRAYADGYYPAAADGFAKLLRSSPAASERLCNLGAARFMAGQASEAVLNFRRAWHRSPRDPDIRHNLRLALRASGAGVYASAGLDGATGRLRPTEWQGLAALCGLLLLGALGGLLTVSRRRETFLLLAVLSVIAGLAARAAARDGARRIAAEAVVVRRDSARLAPTPTALPSFECPEGSLVRVIDTSSGWSKIELRADRGWLPSDAVERVQPDH